MAIKVISEGPVITRKHTCTNCGYELEFTNVDLVSHRTDSDGDACETRGKYLVCPHKECNFRNLVDTAKPYGSR
jgi:hypothetical protein